MICPSILVWNCRGANSSSFFRHLIDLVKLNKPDILILVETRCSSLMIDRIYRKSYFNCYCF